MLSNTHGNVASVSSVLRCSCPLPKNPTDVKKAIFQKPWKFMLSIYYTVSNREHFLSHVILTSEGMHCILKSSASLSSQEIWHNLEKWCPKYGGPVFYPSLLYHYGWIPPSLLLLTLNWPSFLSLSSCSTAHDQFGDLYWTGSMMSMFLTDFILISTW